jgi:hypothetical protein
MLIFAAESEIRAKFARANGNREEDIRLPGYREIRGERQITCPRL